MTTTAVVIIAAIIVVAVIVNTLVVVLSFRAITKKDRILRQENDELKMQVVEQQMTNDLNSRALQLQVMQFGPRFTRTRNDNEKTTVR